MSHYRIEKRRRPMKKHSRYTALIALFCLFPAFAAAQTRTEEWVDTGRFGAEEPDDPGAADTAEKGFTADWLYVGLRAGPSLRFYTPAADTPYTGGDTLSVSLDLALEARVQVLAFLSIQAELMFTWDNASLWAYRGTPHLRYTKDYRSFSFRIPLVVKYDFYPGRFRLSPFIGAYCVLPLGKLEASNSLDNSRQSLSYELSSPLGLLGGLSGALQFGPGVIIADLRYAADLGEFKGRDTAMEKFRRSMVSFTVGYEFGFFPKKKGGRP
jgi:hypothetical protein